MTSHVGQFSCQDVAAKKLRQIVLTKTEFQPNDGKFCSIPRFTVDSVFIDDFRDSVNADFIWLY